MTTENTLLRLACPEVKVVGKGQVHKSYRVMVFFKLPHGWCAGSVVVFAKPTRSVISMSCVWNKMVALESILNFWKRSDGARTFLEAG
jgi:hypothetical protein